MQSYQETLKKLQEHESSKQDSVSVSYLADLKEWIDKFPG
jgi:hypothetical protein